MLPPKLKILSKFGRQKMTGSDFMELCRLNGIQVIFSEDCSRGMYYFADGKHVIAISTKLNRTERANVIWHEFAHFLQNYETRRPLAAFSDVLPSTVSERLADVFALIATRPDMIRITGPRDFIKMIMRTEIASSEKEL